MRCRDFDTTRKDNHSSFLTPTVVGGRRLIPSKIGAQSDPPLLINADFRQISAYNVSTVGLLEHASRGLSAIAELLELL